MDDASLVEMRVFKVSPYLREDRPLMWLGEKNVGKPRFLPIAIGEFEAAAIQMPIDGETPIRPISYDLLCSMLDRLRVRIEQIVIHTVHKSIYYAQIAIGKQDCLKEIDARPSDAVALALRTGAPIFVSSELLDRAGLIPLEEEMEIERTLERFCELESQVTPRPKAHQASSPETLLTSPPTPSPLQLDAQPDQLSLLQTKLAQAIVCEAYEEAARLRDEIESLINKNIN